MFLPHEGREENDDGRDVAQDPSTANRWLCEVTGESEILFFFYLTDTFHVIIKVQF